VKDRLYLENPTSRPSQEVDELVDYLRDIAFFQRSQHAPRLLETPYGLFVIGMSVTAVGGGAVLFFWLNPLGAMIKILGG
jgi:hypothetical protein